MPFSFASSSSGGKCVRQARKRGAGQENDKLLASYEKRVNSDWGRASRMPGWTEMTARTEWRRSKTAMSDGEDGGLTGKGVRRQLGGDGWKERRRRGRGRAD